AVEADLSQGIANLAAVLAARLLYCKQRHRDRVVSLGMIRIGYLVVGWLDLSDQLLRSRNVGGRRAAVVRGVEHAIHGIAAQFDILRQRNAVAAETWQRHVHRRELLRDQRAFSVARPFDEHLSGTCFDASKLRREVQIASRVTFLRDDLESKLVCSRL